MKPRSRAGGKASKARGREALKTKRRDASKTASSSAPVQDTEVARLTRELNEALERQAATSEVLEVISGSPGDLQPVFAAMLENAVRICDGNFGNIYRWDGEALHMVATHNTPPAFAEDRRHSPYRPYPQSPIGRMVIDKTVAHISDLTAEEVYLTQKDPVAVSAVALGGIRTLLGVPLLNKDEMIGAFFLSRQEVRPFNEKQIALVKNFTAQAVVAIENARLLNELRQRTTDLTERTADLTEALEQQTATSEVLQVISGSSGDLEPAFRTVLENAVRLCGAKFGTINRWDGEALHLAATHKVPPAFAEFRRRTPFRPGPENPISRMLMTKTIIHSHDLGMEQGYIERNPTFVAAVELGGVRTFLAVPMLKENDLIGVIIVYRQEVRPFSEKQIELVKNFAAQAVIAIENARLLNELRQSLEQQTATAEVLKVVSRSPGDLQPVFATMLENAVRICGANFGNMFLYENETYRAVAMHNAPEAYARLRTDAPLRPPPGTALGRVAATKQVVQITDLMMEDAYKQGASLAVTGVTHAGIRTLLAVPMLKDDHLVGAIVIYRREVRLFDDKQIELVKNFAAQAVIAIENARLLNELRQSLERQTATSEVLQVISSSPGDLEPVFAAMLDKAVGICDAQFGTLYLREADGLRLISTHNVPPAFAETQGKGPFRPAPHGMLDAVMKTGGVVHLADLAEAQSYLERDPRMVEAVEVGGIRTVVGVPLLKEGELIGLIGIYRREVRPFTDRQIALVTNFANQAVIAIENARLLNELRQRTTDLTERTAELTEALDQQTATSEVLQVISSSPGNLEPVFAAMLENAARICDANFGNIFRWDGDALHLIATHNTPPPFAEYRKRQPLPLKPNLPFARMVAAKTVVHCADAAALPAYVEQHDPEVTAAVELGNIRTFVAVPMLKEDKLIGALIVYRQEVRPFTDKQIELVKNFAAQAVIAIENARLLNELRKRTADLTESLEQQTATSDVLQVISRSPGALEPIFKALLENATRLCGASYGNMWLREGDAFRCVAVHGVLSAYWEIGALIHPEPDVPISRAAKTKQPFQIADIRASQLYRDGNPTAVSAVNDAGVQAVLAVPMLKENDFVGAIVIYNKEAWPFTDKQIGLLENFASQAVIAIENARLLRELRERTEQVEAQSQEVVKLNQQLEQRVADQVGEIERMGRLRRFLPRQVADLIVASGSEKQLESHRREITALFCDLRGFTGFTESADAEDVMALLRDYHAAIGEIIIKYNGTLERYAGDGVMVVFNDPVPVENPALQAVLMALEVRDAIGALTATWRRLGHDIGFGIGIAHGFATLGTIGFEGRFDYAAIGTVSNVASRLCDEAKPGQILISPRVLTKVENAVQVEPVGEFELKGIRRPLAAYNVIAASSSKV